MSADTRTHVSSSYVSTSRGGEITSYVGPDATRLAAAIVLRSAIKMWRLSGIIPTRGMTIRRMLERAEFVTGTRYGAPRGTSGASLAEQHLTLWIEAMRSAMPVEVQE